jgi:hypothetical protein
MQMSHAWSAELNAAISGKPDTCAGEEAQKEEKRTAPFIVLWPEDMP